MKKTISLVLSVLLLIVSICAITVIVYADDGDITFYDVYVGGVRVNSENMDDILGDGTAAYTPASGDEDAKLTIANTTISSAYAVETKDGFAVANIVADESLQVEFIGNNNLSASTYSSIANNAEIYDDTLINLNAIYICDSAEEERNLTISGDYASINSNVAESVAISVPDKIYFDAKKVETSGKVVSRNNGDITLRSGAFEIINRKDDTKNAFGSSNIVIDSSLDANEIDSYYATSYGGEYIQSTISDINSYTADNEGAGICRLYIGVHIYFYLEGEPVTYKNIADPRYDESVTYDKETKTITLHDNVQIQNNTFLTSGKFEKDQKIKLLSGIVITEAAEDKEFTNIPNIEATGDATFKCTRVATNGLNYTSEGNLTIESYGSTKWGTVIGGSQAVIRANNIDIKSNRPVSVINSGSIDIFATGSVSIENKTETTNNLVCSGTFNVEADSLTLNGYTNEYGMVSCGSSGLNIKKDITVTNEGTGSSFGSGNTEITAENIAMTGNGKAVLSGGSAATITATGDITITNAGKGSAISSGNTKISCVNLKAENNGDEYTISGGSALIIEATGDVSAVNKGESGGCGAITSGGTTIIAKSLNATSNTVNSTTISGGMSLNINCTGDVTVSNAAAGSAISSGGTKISCVNLKAENNGDNNSTISGGSKLEIEATGDVTVNNKGKGYYTSAISSGGTTITAKSLTAEANSTSGAVISGGSKLEIEATGDVTVLNSAAGSAISSGDTTINCANLKTENNGDDNSTISGGSALTIKATGDVTVNNKGKGYYTSAISSGGTTITAKSLTAEANSTGGSTISGGSSLNINCTGDVTVLNSAAGSAISSGNTTINCANLKTENNGDNNTISGGTNLKIEATGDVTVNNKGKGNGAISSGGTTITAKSLTAEANSTGSSTISGGSSLNINCKGDVNVSNLASNSAISSGDTTIKAANITATSDGGYSATISGGNSLTIEATGKVKAISNPEKNGNNAITSGGTKITAGSLEAKTNSGAAAISGGSSLVIDCKGNVDVSNASTGNAISSAKTTVKGANITVTSNGNSDTIAGGSKVTMTATGDITVLNTAQENGGTAISCGEASLSGKSLTVSNKGDSATMSTGMKTTLDFTGDITVTNKQNGTTISTGALDIKNAKNVTIEANCQGSAIPTGSISINATGDVTLRNNMKEGSAIVTSCGNFNVKADSLKVEGYSNNSTIISNDSTKIETNKNVSMRNNGSYVVVSTGKLDIVSGGNVDITAAESSGTVIAGGSGIKIDAKGSVTVKAESGEKSNGMLISAGGVDIKAASFNAVGYTNGESMLACGNGLTIDVTGDATITNNGNGLAIAGTEFNVKNAKNVTVTSNSDNYTVGTGSVDVNAENSAVILNKSEKGGAVSSSSMKATANNVVIKGNTSGALINCGTSDIKADEITIENANKDGVVNSYPITVSLKSGGDIYTSSGDKLKNEGESITIPAGSNEKISAGTHTTHAYVVSKQVAATCTADGISTFTCECGNTYTQAIPAAGHSFRYVYNNDATCTEDGTKTAKCDRCDVTDTLADEGSATGHTIVTIEAAAPTCTESGLTEGSYCSVCNEILAEQKDIPATGHNDKNNDGKCDTCGVVTDASLINPCKDAKINVASADKIDYRSKVTIKATATNVPDGYYLVMTVDGKEIKGTNTEVSYSAGEIKSDINYTVKVVDADGNVQKDASGNDLITEGGKITCNKGFFKMIIAFFKGLFGMLPEVDVKP